MKYEIEMTVARGDSEFDLLIKGDVTPGSDGRYSGPPELCYPAEPNDAEIEEVMFDGSAWNGELTKAENEKAQELLIEAYTNNPPEPDFEEEPYYD